MDYIFSGNGNITTRTVYGPTALESSNYGSQFVCTEKSTTVSSVTNPLTVQTNLAANVNRKRVFIQNCLASVPLYVKLGAACSTTNYSFILPACNVNDDGTGGFWTDDEYTGQISYYGTSYRYNHWERS